MRSFKQTRPIQPQLCLTLLVGVLIGMTLMGMYVQFTGVHHILHTDHRDRGDPQSLRIRLRMKSATAEKQSATADQQSATADQQSPTADPQQFHHKETTTAITPSKTAQLQTYSTHSGAVYVATAANAAYFGGLTNLVGSLRFWCPECHVLVYNLGLTKGQLDTVKSWCNTTLMWEQGVAGAAHLQEAHKYAWKPIAILDAVDTYKNVLWLDAGSTVTTPLRTKVLPLLLKDGYFLVQGQDLDMVPWCHDLTWQYFKLDKEKFKGKPSYSGNTMGYVYDSTAYHKILRPWVECAKVEACMAPPGTSTGNHRFDQSVLSIIAYTADMHVAEHTELLLAEGVECYRPHPRAVWTSRQGCSCYQKYAVGCEAAGKLQLGVTVP